MPSVESIFHHHSRSIITCKSQGGAEIVIGVLILSLEFSYFVIEIFILSFLKFSIFHLRSPFFIWVLIASLGFSLLLWGSHSSFLSQNLKSSLNNTYFSINNTPFFTNSMNEPNISALFQSRQPRRKSYTYTEVTLCCLGCQGEFKGHRNNSTGVIKSQGLTQHLTARSNIGSKQSQQRL